MLSMDKIADCIGREYQSRSSSESAEVLTSLARRMADTLEDPREREAFLSTASMSGLDCEDTDHGHVGHFSRLGGTWWCDTCDSPYCELA